MKNILLMGAVGLGLFSATVAGLLGAQGRLNYAGTKNIPVLNLLFSPPAETEGEGEGEGEGKGKGEGEHGEGKDGSDAGGHGQDGHGGHGDDHDQSKSEHGKQAPKIEYVEGRSIKDTAAAADDGKGGGHGETGGGDDHGEHEKKRRKLAKTPGRPEDQADPEKKRQEELQRRFERKKEWLHSVDNRYRGPGDLFQMPKIKAGMSVSEVNSVVARAQEMMKDIERKQAVLEEERRNLEVRERDIADRQSSVSKLINQVEEQRTKVEQAIEDFNKRVFYLKPQEEAGLKEIARSVGSLSPEVAKALIMNYWRTPEGQKKAIKILAVMDREQVDQIVAQMETQVMREILEKRMALVRLDK